MLYKLSLSNTDGDNQWEDSLSHPAVLRGRHADPWGRVCRALWKVPRLC